jgi:uncharacterized protein YprB with RNaseH-like and TPR domain
MVMKHPGWLNFLDFSRNTLHLEVSHRSRENWKCMYLLCQMGKVSKSITGLDRPCVFQDVEAPN